MKPHQRRDRSSIGIPSDNELLRDWSVADGKADVVIGYVTAPGAVFFNDGAGRSFKQVRFGDGKGAVYGIALGDLNGDGYPDIAAARSDAPNVVYFSGK